MIKEHKEKNKILNLAKSFNVELLSEFEQEIIDMFVANSYIPHSYQLHFNAETIENIEDRFELKKRRYLYEFTLEPAYVRLLKKNSVSLHDEDFHNKLMSDYNSNVDDYIYYCFQKMYNYTDNILNEETTDLSKLIIQWEEEFLQNFLKELANTFDIFFLFSDDITLETIIDKMNAKNDDFENVIMHLSFLTIMNFNSGVCVEELVDYYESNEPSGVDSEVELEKEVLIFKKDIIKR